MPMIDIPQEIEGTGFFVPIDIAPDELKPINCKCSMQLNIEQNRIVAAAVKKYGVVFTGVRHGYIIKTMVEVGFLKDKEKDYVQSSEQGFVDLYNNYHTRKDAKIIAIKAEQISPDHKGLLYSEDLW